MLKQQSELENYKTYEQFIKKENEDLVSDRKPVPEIIHLGSRRHSTPNELLPSPKRSVRKSVYGALHRPPAPSTKKEQIVFRAI